MVRAALPVAAMCVLVGCTPSSEEQIASTQSGAVKGGSDVKAEVVVSSRRSLTDRGWQTQMTRSVVVHRKPRTEFGLKCEIEVELSPSLSLDTPGERVAYRCAPRDPWQVVFMRKTAGRPFNLCARVAGDTLDWSKVPTFAAARAGLLDCPTSEGQTFGNSFKELYLESRARDAEVGGAAFLVETLGLDVGGVKQVDNDQWDQAWESLPESKRAPIRAALQATLVPGAPAPALLRALKHADLSSSDPALVDTIERVGRAAPSEIIVRYLASRRPAAAADIACSALEPIAANGVSVILDRAELAAITATGKPCNIDGVFDRNDCSDGFGCCHRGFTCGSSLRHPCTEAEMRALVQLELSRPPQKPWPGGGGFGYELLVGAARAQPKSAAARRFLERVKNVPTCGKD